MFRPSDSTFVRAAVVKHLGLQPLLPPSSKRLCATTMAQHVVSGVIAWTIVRSLLTDDTHRLYIVYAIVLLSVLVLLGEGARGVMAYEIRMST